MHLNEQQDGEVIMQLEAHAKGLSKDLLGIFIVASQGLSNQQSGVSSEPGAQ